MISKLEAVAILAAFLSNNLDFIEVFSCFKTNYQFP